MATPAAVLPIHFPGPNSNLLPGFLAGNAHNPGLLLIQEWWGVTDIIKQQAALFADRGFRVLVPDLYKGTVGVNMEEAYHLLTSLDYHLALQEIGCAVRFLQSTGTGNARVGITGGCMGGALAFAAAQHVPTLSCAAPWYGTPAREMPWIKVEEIKIPVQYHTGMLDSIQAFSDPATALDLTERMRKAGCDVELYLYEDTAHSFMNALVPEGVDMLRKWGYEVPPPQQVVLCFDRVVAFLDKHLRQKHTRSVAIQAAAARKDLQE